MTAPSSLPPTDADLIYNACLRAERRLEASHERARRSGVNPTAILVSELILSALTALREEIGTGLATERP